MKQSALEQYTKQKKLYGQNQQQILDKFVQYSSYCCDPISVYKYMEQKSICIYLANYWTSRAILFAQMGDFRDAILCLKEARERDHIVSETQIRIQEFVDKVKRKMVIAMKRMPPKSKRSVNQYNFLYEKQTKPTIESLDALTDLFEKNYKEAKKQIEKQFDLKMHGKKKSWMSSIYEQNEENIRKISQKMKTVNNLESYLSMRTPMNKKDPMRLTKTMDSVQMLKKKKSTQPKQNKKAKFNENNNINEAQNQMNKICNSESDEEENAAHQEQICVHTTPVGRQLSILSRRVTFNTKNKLYDKIEKIRGEEESNPKDLDSHSLEKSKQDQSEEQQIDHSKSISKRGSILKNKKTQEEYLKMDQE